MNFWGYIRSLISFWRCSNGCMFFGCNRLAIGYYQWVIGRVAFLVASPRSFTVALHPPLKGVQLKLQLNLYRGDEKAGNSWEESHV